MGHFLQITIARKTIQFLLIENCRIGPLSANCDRKKKPYYFSRKTIQFLLIANCIRAPLSANYDRKKNYTISPYRKLQNRVTFCKLRSQEKLDHFSRKTIQFLLIANCRIGPLSANYDRKKNFTISQEKLYSFS